MYWEHFVPLSNTCKILFTQILFSPKLLTMRVVRRGTLLRNIAELRGKYHDDSTFWLAQSDKTFRPSRMRILMVRWAEVNWPGQHWSILVWASLLFLNAKHFWMMVMELLNLHRKVKSATFASFSLEFPKGPNVQSSDSGHPF